MSAPQSARTERIVQELSAVLAAHDLLVEDITVTPAGKRRLVRVLIDIDTSSVADATTAIAPLDLDTVAEATRLISDALDESDAMGEQPYVLEVSSPGTDRPLSDPRHFRRNVGRLVKLTLRAGNDEGDRDGVELTGRITAADADAVTLAITDAKGATSEQTFAYRECSRAVLELEFNRPDATVDFDDDSTDDSTDEKEDD